MARAPEKRRLKTQPLGKLISALHYSTTLSVQNMVPPIIQNAENDNQNSKNCKSRMRNPRMRAIFTVTASYSNTTTAFLKEN